MAYRTQAQLQAETAAAKDCSLLLIAEHFGYFIKQRGNVCVAEGESGLVFFPNTNSYYDYYENRGGSGIDFVIRENGFNVGEAVRYINDNIAHVSYENMQSISQKKFETVKKQEELLVPPRNNNHKRVFAYLTKSRGITPEVVTNFLHRNLLYEQADKHNAIFVGYDKNMQPKHCFMRGTISGVLYRGDTYGSDKNYGFYVPADCDHGEHNRLLVFEAPIDLMSYKSLYPADDCDMLALGMLSLEPVYTYLNEYRCESISFLLDADEPGKKAVLKFTTELTAKGYQVLPNPVSELLEQKQVKDVNELLLVSKSEQIKKGGVKL